MHMNPRKMWNNLSVFVLVVLILVNKIVPGTGDGKDTGTLQLVQVLFRHGDRNPLSTFPTDPNNLESNWPEGYGQLTTIGKKQLYDLGAYLRDRYDGYLSKIYFVNDTLVKSSDNDRTIMSAMAALAGLYPPMVEDDTVQVWNPVTNFQLVPVHTIPKKIDRLLNTEREACPNFPNVVKTFIKTSKYMQDLNREAKDVLKYISVSSGLKITFVNDLVYRLHDALYIQLLRNMSIPDWAEPLMKPDSEFKKIVEKCYTAFSMTPELRRLYSGELLKELLKNMKDKVEEKSQLRLVMYSGHDLTITNLMNTMGIYSNEIPPYASSLTFELHKNPESSEYTVKILYQNDTNLEPYNLEVPGCETPCELNRLEGLMSPSISENWDQECNVGLGCYSSPPSPSTPTTATKIQLANEVENNSCATTYPTLLITLGMTILIFETNLR